MPNFTITEVSSRTRDWDGQGNSKNRSYYVKVEGDEKIYELAQKADKAAPKAGDSFEANVEEREHQGTTYYKLKRVYANNGGGGGGRPRDPAERASIERQKSADIAANLLVGFMASGWKPAGPSDLANEFDAFYVRVHGKVGA